MPIDTASVQARVRRYILENLLFSDNQAELPDAESLLDRGIIDSTGVLELVMFLEEEYGLKIKASEMLPANFDTVQNIVAFVQRSAA